MKQISKKELTQDVNARMKKDELCAKYGINKFQMTNILKEAGLKIKKTQTKKVVLVDDVDTTIEENTLTLN